MDIEQPDVFAMFVVAIVVPAKFDVPQGKRVALAHRSLGGAAKTAEVKEILSIAAGGCVPVVAVQPFNANVAPVSNPPSVAGFISVVCAVLVVLNVIKNRKILYFKIEKCGRKKINFL